MPVSNSTPAQDPIAAFAALYPRLRLVKQRGDTSVPGQSIPFYEITVDGAAADLLDAGFLTQGMLDAMPPCGRKWFYPGEHSCAASCIVSRVKAGTRVNIWGDDGPLPALREKLGMDNRPEPIEAIEPRSIDGAASLRGPSLLTAPCPPELNAARMQALVGLGKLSEAAHSLTPRIGDEIFRRLQSVEDLMRKELERHAELAKPQRPSYLRLAIDNEARP